MTNEQILAHVRAMRQNAVAAVSSADVILASMQPAPQEAPEHKPRWLGEKPPPSEPNGEATNV